MSTGPSCAAAHNTLVQLKKAALQSDKYLEIFKRELNIRRDPKKTLSKQAHYLWITFYAIVEIIANIFFFNVGFSAPDALAISVLLAAINLLISVAVGNYWRNKNSPGTERYFAHGAFALWLIFVIWFNTATAITRSVMLLGETGLPRAAGQAFFHDSWGIFLLSPPNISDLMSVLLWIAGAAVGAFAFFEGYRSEDPIPGFTEKVDAAKHNSSAYNDAEHALRVATDRERIEVETRFDTIRANLRNALSQFNSLTGAMTAESNLAVRDHELVKDAYVQLINAYRDENRVRASPVPAYFSEPLTLDTPSAVVPPRCDEEQLKTRKENLQNMSNTKQNTIVAQKEDFTSKASTTLEIVDEAIRKADHSAREALRAFH